jgi:hypothetical protein
MPEKKLVERARAAKRQGKSASTQSGVFVKDEIERVRKGEHGVRSAKQAIAIGLSKARRAAAKQGANTKGAAGRSAAAKKAARTRAARAAHH